MPLRQLFPHSKAPDSGPPKVDIIAVHGLNPRSKDDAAHAWDTWRTPPGPNGRLWLRDDLPQYLPDARIFLYEYNSTAVYGKDRDTFVGKANELLEAIRIKREDGEVRPIILLGHSMGGLLIKQALVNADSNPRYTPIKDATTGLAFFATPHHGGDGTLVSLGKIASKIAMEVGFQKGDDVLETLKKGSIFSEILDEHWRHQSLSYDIVSFWGGLDNIVPMHSTRLGMAGEREHIVKLNGDHRRVCKFGDNQTDQDNLELVSVTLRDLYSKAIQRSIQRITTHPVASKEGLIDGQYALKKQFASLDISDASSSRQPRAPHYYIPFKRNKRFVRREAILNRLQGAFFSRDAEKAALVGLGGVGKTQVALQFAYWVQDHKPEYSVFWVSALSNASFEQAYTDVARELSIYDSRDKGDLKGSVQRYLSSANIGPWLLIIDNADDPDSIFGGTEAAGNISQWLPESEQGLTLFTTRSMDVAMSAVEDTEDGIVEMHDMTSQESMSLFEKWLMRKSMVKEKEVPALLQELNHLPLAITQAAAYLNRNRISVAKYLQLLQGTEKEMITLLQREFHDNARYKESQHGIATTWLISFDQIRKFDSNAADILSFIAHIEPKAIPLSMIPSFEAEEQMVQAIGTLCGYAFLTRREYGDMFDMHSLVHLGIRVWLQREGRGEQTAERAMLHMNDVFPRPDWRQRFVWRRYLPHALRILRSGDKPETHAIEKFGFCEKVVGCLRADGRMKEAVELLEESVRWAATRWAEDDTSLVNARYHLAVGYGEVGETNKAISMLERVLAAEKRTLPANHPSRLISQHRLASLYREDGQIQRAVDLLESILPVIKEVHGEDSAKALHASHDLGMAYREAGRTVDAIALLKHVAAVRERAMSEDDPDRLASQSALGLAYLDNDETGKALALLQHVAAVRDGALSRDHPHLLKSQHNLALAYLGGNEVGKAIELLESVVATEEGTLPQSHPDLLASQSVLSTAYLRNNEIGKAVGLLQHVVAVRGKTLPEGHPDLLKSQHNLAQAYLNMQGGQVSLSVPAPELDMEDDVRKTGEASEDEAIAAFIASEAGLALRLQWLRRLSIQETVRQQRAIRPELRRAVSASLQAMNTPQWLSDIVKFNYADNGIDDADFATTLILSHATERPWIVEAPFVDAVTRGLEQSKAAPYMEQSMSRYQGSPPIELLDYSNDLDTTFGSTNMTGHKAVTIPPPPESPQTLRHQDLVFNIDCHLGVAGALPICVPARRFPWLPGFTTTAVAKETFLRELREHISLERLRNSPGVAPVYRAIVRFQSQAETNAVRGCEERERMLMLRIATMNRQLRQAILRCQDNGRLTYGIPYLYFENKTNTREPVPFASIRHVAVPFLLEFFDSFENLQRAPSTPVAWMSNSMQLFGSILILTLGLLPIALENSYGSIADVLVLLYCASLIHLLSRSSPRHVDKPEDINKKLSRSLEGLDVPGIARSSWENRSELLHNSSLAVQAVSLAVQCAMRGCNAPVVFDFLEDRVVEFVLEGSSMSRQPIIASATTLTCLGDMLGGQVLVFGTRWMENPQPLDLMASIKDVISIWGPGELDLVPTPRGPSISKVRIGGGTLQRVPHKHARMHWAYAEESKGVNPESQASTSLTVLFNEVVRIGVSDKLSPQVAYQLSPTPATTASRGPADVVTLAEPGAPTTTGWADSRVAMAAMTMTALAVAASAIVSLLATIAYQKNSPIQANFKPQEITTHEDVPVDNLQEDAVHAENSPVDNPAPVDNPPPLPRGYFNPVGPIAQPRHCGANEDSEKNRRRQMDNQMKALGTHPAYHQYEGQDWALQAGQYAVLQWTQKWRYVNDVTLRGPLLDQDSGLAQLCFDLDQNYGLFVSSTTKVMCRAKLRDLVAFAGPILYREEFPMLENQTAEQSVRAIVEALRSTNAPAAWDLFLPPTATHDRKRLAESSQFIGLVYKVLNRLKSTGVTPWGSFETAWISPADQGQKVVTHSLKRAPWLRFLKDDENKATFACISPLCLQELGKEHQDCQTTSCSLAKDLEKFTLATRIQPVYPRGNNNGGNNNVGLEVGREYIYRLDKLTTVIGTVKRPIPGEVEAYEIEARVSTFEGLLKRVNLGSGIRELKEVSETYGKPCLMRFTG